MHFNLCAQLCGKRCACSVSALPKWIVWLHVLQELCSCAYSETCSDIRWLRSPDLEQLQSVCLLRATASARVKARGAFKCAAAFFFFSPLISLSMLHPILLPFQHHHHPPSVCSAWATSTSLRRPRWASSALRAWPKWSWEWPAGESPTVTLSPSPTRVWCWRCSRTASGSRYGSLLYSASQISIHFNITLLTKHLLKSSMQF